MATFNRLQQVPITSTALTLLLRVYSAHAHMCRRHLHKDRRYSLVVIAKGRKQLKYPSTGHQLNKRMAHLNHGIHAAVKKRGSSLSTD